MPDLLLELFSEEIPSRMQSGAARELERLVVGALSDRGLLFEGVRSFAGPRRLTLAVSGLPARQPDVSEERKGPRVGAPEKAIEGFLRSTGVTPDQCIKQPDAKGEFYVAVIRRAGRATEELLAEVLPETLEQLIWPKSMRWNSGSARWVRPLHSILCTCDGEVVPFEFAGVTSSNRTRGHRFLSAGEIEVRRFEDYEEKLATASVVLDPMQRRESILHESKQKAFALGLRVIEDEALLDEVVGLVEWPVALIGRIDHEFMDLPPEVLQTSMRLHQKFFALGEAEGGPICSRFLVVANIAAEDGGREIVAGNERVLRARLSDAKFFWDQDRRHRLDTRVPELRKIVFHARAGTMLDRVHRLQSVAIVLSRILDFDMEKAGRAALLSKADLLSGMVGEFPELQGTMGRYYALHDGEHDAVANAVGDHYRPLGPSDRVPAEPVAIVVALADKIDTLVMLWRAGEKPTGSKDPFALRRAGLGIIRIVLENRLRLPLSTVLCSTLIAARADGDQAPEARMSDCPDSPGLLGDAASDLLGKARAEAAGLLQDGDREVVSGVLGFLADRLKVALRGEGVRHDLIDAVFSLGNEDDLLRLVARVKALDLFLASAAGANLLVAYRRAVNILRIEEKRDGCSYEGEPDPDLLEHTEERRLFAVLAGARELIQAELAYERFTEAMTAMSRLREPVDAFFDKVTVNAPDAGVRKNRLLLLSRLRSVLQTTADFSRIEG
ncbi:MAG TPA: glycine--tRNA ligase subunit beta [Rhizomicrobium sp.]|jgi:glycyl-tRNA synthetase beta chain|nr:glycine--tRNA ligase subunit beta [Rhizomicrobium sp.]